MVEITNGIDYIFIKNMEDIYKIELFEDYYYSNEKNKEYKIKIYCYNSNYDEYTYSISFKTNKRAKKEYMKIIKIIRGE